MKKAGAVVFGLLLALLLGEGLCRVGAIPGRRGEARAAGNAPGKFKILILGDSFSGPGRGAEFWVHMRGYCAAPGVSCLNLARGGMRPVDYLRTLSDYGDEYRPDAVLVSITATNDVTDTQTRTTPEEISAALAARRPPIRFWLGEVVAERWKRVVRWNDERKVARQLAEFDKTPDENLNPFLAVVGRFTPDFVLRNALLRETGSAWDDIAKILLRVRELGEAGGARVLFTLYPSPAQVSHDHDEFYRLHRLALTPELTATSPLQDRFDALCAKNGLDCVDLLPAYRRAKKPLYLDWDDHPNREGARIAFEAITARVDALRARRPAR